MRSLETQFGLDIDVREFVELAGRSAGAVERAGKRAINSIAFDLKKRTPEILDKLIDCPTPFTRLPSAVNVQRASSSEEGAILYINKIQSQYLGNLEYGASSAEASVAHPLPATARPTNMATSAASSGAALVSSR